MDKLVQLIAIEGRWINPEQIVCLEPVSEAVSPYRHDRSSLTFAGGKTLRLTLTVDGVVDILRSAGVEMVAGVPVLNLVIGDLDVAAYVRR